MDLKTIPKYDLPDFDAATLAFGPNESAYLTREQLGDWMDQYPHETTVPAHAPRGFGRGMALKAPDWAIAYACYWCHDVVDGRSHIKDTTADERMMMWSRGFYKTMTLLIEQGLVVIS